MRTWAFLISAAEYDEHKYDLGFVRNDNECMREGLVQGLRIPQEQIICCDAKGYVAYSDLERILSDYSTKIVATDRVIIYFSGHGGGAPFSVKFSDKDVEFDCFCALADRLSAQAKVFILDCCYAGNSDLPSLENAHPSIDLFDYVQSGHALFASSNGENPSLCHPERNVSLYTYCFSKALCQTRIRNGKLSLIDVAKYAAHEVTRIATNYGRKDQHPIYKCQIPDGVQFQVTEEKMIEENVYSSVGNEYDIYSTKILHSSIEMRYAVQAIIKGPVDDEHVALYTKKILDELKPLRKFKTHQQALRFFFEGVKVVFVYWGMNEADVIRCNWIYRSTWADQTSDRDNWYRVSGKNERIVDDIKVSIGSNYQMLNKFFQVNVASDKELIKATHEIADPILSAAKFVVSLFDEYDNGDIPERAFIQACTEPFKQIQRCYFRMSNLPIPSIELKEWADGYDCLTASIDDMRIYFTTKAFQNRDIQNRKACMLGAIQRYRDDLHRLVRIEEKLKKSGVLPVEEKCMK